MRTIFRLLIIAGLISYFRGPFKAEHPVTYQEGLDTIKTIPHVLGQMLTNDLTLLPQKSSSNDATSNREQPTAPEPTTQPLSILSDLLKVFEGASTGKEGLSEWVSGKPIQAENLQITGLSQKETGQLIGHLRTLDLIQVVPKLESLSSQIKQVEQTDPSALTPEEQKKVVDVFQQTVHVLKVTPRFTIEQGKRQTISFAELLKEPNLEKDKVKVQIADQSNHELAQFTISFNQKASSTPVLSEKTESHPF